MRRVILMVAILVGSIAGAQDADPIAGLWQGTLNAGGQQLRLGMDFKKTDTGYTGTMDSIDQGANDIPMSSVGLNGKDVTFEIKAAAGAYSGMLSDDGSEIAGTWKQGPTSMPLTLRRVMEGEALPQLARPQEPKPPLPYKEVEVTYTNPDAAGVELAGTLTLPPSNKPVPAVVLITGSGPQDRDESVAGHRPFLIIADYLSRHGIAVLRADDRGTAKSKGDFENATSEDFAGDALAGVAFLKGRPEIDASRIGLLGHSEGGLIAPICAVRSEDVAFIVLLAGPAVPGEAILLEQGRLIALAMGMPETMVEQTLVFNREVYGIIGNSADAAEAEKKLRALIDGLPEEQRRLLDQSGFDLETQLPMINTPWFRNFMKYDPRQALANVTCPVLAVFGEFDLQVPAEQNQPEMIKALAGNPDHEVVVVAGVNHLFQSSTTGSPAEYSQIEETMTPKTLELMEKWISAHYD